MRAGLLDRRITIQSLEVARDAVGGQVETWTTVVADLPAQRMYIRGTELFAAQQLHKEEVRKYRIRYRSNISTTNRIIDGSDTLDILYVAELGRREGLEITARIIGG